MLVKKIECGEKYSQGQKKANLDGFSVLSEKAGRKDVFEKMMEDILVLDAAYGVDRQVYSMGGFLLYFPADEDYKASVDTIAKVYHFDLGIYEFDDSIWEDTSAGVVWRMTTILDL